MDGTVLVADDDRTIRTVLTQALTRAGCRVHATSSLTTLMRWVAEGKGDTIITDVIMPDGNGLEMLPKIATDRPDLPVIVISAQNTIMTAIQAADAKAFDYLPKPFDLPDLMKRVAKALEQKKLSHRSNKEQDDVSETNDELPLVGKSAPMQGVYRLVARLMNTDLPILVSGESGTGKEVIAKTIHELSNRKQYPFIALNMAAIPKDLIESELFGHEKGSFTGAITQYQGKFLLAQHGTLFLDEIGDMPPNAQTRLLRVLQEKEFTPIGATKSIKTNARILAATQQPLEDMVEEGKFRKDLFFRLNVIPIYVPPLRERISDLPLLVDFFLQKIVTQGLPRKIFEMNALNTLSKYSWPGNIRELENFIKRLSILAPEEEISPELISENLPNQTSKKEKLNNNNNITQNIQRLLNEHFSAHKPNLPPPGLYNRIISEIERPLIEISLKATKGNQFQAALMLGINRNTLRKKIKELKISIVR